ncbi:MAG: hypothetical protein WDA75_11320 [Candidatus Latescibacterota bacterium]|jgi:hypothetical protein
MNLLVLLPAITVALTLLTAIVSAREVRRLKAKLAQLSVRLVDAQARLQQSQQHRITVVGTLEMLGKIKTGRLAQIDSLQQELKSLEEEVAPDHEIGQAVPPTRAAEAGL